MTTYRVWKAPFAGRVLIRFDHPSITLASVVHISICECTGLNGPPVAGVAGQTWRPVMSLVNFSVQTVGVRDGGVDFWVLNEDLEVRPITCDITVLDAPSGTFRLP